MLHLQLKRKKYLYPDAILYFKECNFSEKILCLPAILLCMCCTAALLSQAKQIAVI